MRTDGNLARNNFNNDKEGLPIKGHPSFFFSLFVTFHIFRNFAMRSRVFLSQLSVTDDESRFLYFLKRLLNCILR